MENSAQIASTEIAQPRFLPMSRLEMDALGWEELDVLLVSGDAYVDHPTFGVALLGRWLVAHGFRVGVVAQPGWRDTAGISCMGRPRLFAGVTAGALDSMLAHFTAFKKRRSDDAYTPGGLTGKRPDRTTIVYTNLVRQAFSGLPVVIGGIEASLRRATHYDFWSDKLRRSILPDSKADALVYGMGERAVLEIARRLAQAGHQPAPKTLLGIPGVAVMGQLEDLPEHAAVETLPSHEEIDAKPAELMRATQLLERQVHQAQSWAVQATGNRFVLMAPPAAPLSTAELDLLYSLPFTRQQHPSYTEPVPGLETVKDSITSHRGCGGGCSFCSLALHQGRAVRSRSAESILAEVRHLADGPDWRGAISDIGGPSANMWGARCTGDKASCARPSCLTPRRCKFFEVDQKAIAGLLDQAASQDGVNHLRVASGVRFDLALDSPEYLDALIKRYVGGQLKIAPEHITPHVLRLMRKPVREVFEDFLDKFSEISRRAGKEQYVVPYLLSAFPGCTNRDMIELGQWLRRRGWRPRQVQCFVPTPGTVATAMFHAGIDEKGQAIPVAKEVAQRKKQHDLLFSPPSAQPTRRRPVPKNGPRRKKR